MKFQDAVHGLQAVADVAGVLTGELTTYSVNVVREMSRRGSLFLWHLKREGRILFDRDNFLAGELSTLQRYESALQDLAVLQRVHAYLRAFAATSELCEYDLHILFMLCRNALMLLTAIAGPAAFGRIEVFDVAVKISGVLPLPRTTYLELSRWHLHYLRNAPRPGTLPDEDAIRTYLGHVEALLILVWEYVNADK
jgi:hypothetical protein